MDMKNSGTLAKAIRIAAVAHEHQEDRAGRAYILHPLRVMARVDREDEKIVAALQDAGLPPSYGFVNGLATEQHAADSAALEAWRAAGQPLGNHAWSHMDLNTHSLEEFEADANRNEPPHLGSINTSCYRIVNTPRLWAHPMS